MLCAVSFYVTIYYIRQRNYMQCSIILFEMCIRYNFSHLSPTQAFKRLLWYFNASNNIWFWQNSQLRKILRGVKAPRDQGHGGGWEGGGPLLAVMKVERLHYWHLASSFMSETEMDSQKKNWHERGTVRVKEKPVNHLKGLWGWHLRFLHLSPFANIPRPQKTPLLIVFDVILFIIIKAGSVWKENTFGLL